jgi:hypothetical protein
MTNGQTPNVTGSPADATIQKAKQAAVNELLLEPKFRGNVLGVGIGTKLVDGIDRPCVRVYVQSKRDPDDLSLAITVPDKYLGFPTAVIEVGFLGRAGKLKPTRDDKPEEGTGPGSSIRLKTSLPNVNQGAGGTLGALVEDQNKNRYILSCNHILNVNGRVNNQTLSLTDLPQSQTADPNTEIITPALSDDPHPVAESSRLFVPLVEGKNSVDCAIAPVIQGKEVKANFRSAKLNPNKPVGDPDIDQKVQKDGAVTGLTYGKIVDVDADFYIEYSFGRFLLSDQVVIQGGDVDFAADGDSGAVVVNRETNQAVAMIFAESGTHALACPLTEVLKQLGERAKRTLTLALD